MHDKIERWQMIRTAKPSKDLIHGKACPFKYFIGFSFEDEAREHSI
jgi:hypothetical protein